MSNQSTKVNRLTTCVTGITQGINRGINMNVKMLIAGSLAAAVMSGVTACSSSSDSAPPVEENTVYERVAPLAAQKAVIEIHDPFGIPTVTIASQPSLIELSGTATRSGTSVEVNLSATNNAPRILFNLKAVVDSSSASEDLGTATIAGSGTLNTEEFVRFENVAVGMEAVSGTDSGFTISGVDQGINDVIDPLVFAVTLPTDHPLVLINDGGSGDGTQDLVLVDVVTNESINADFEELRNPNSSQNGNDSMRFREGVFSPEGQYAYLGMRNLPYVTRLDLVEEDFSVLDLTDGSIKESSEVISRDVAVQKVPTAYTDWVTMSPDQQYLYTAYGQNAHVSSTQGYTNTNNVSLVKIDRDTLEVMATLELVSGSSEPRVRDYQFINDGAGMVVIVQSDDEDDVPASLMTIDLDEMTVSGTIDISPTATTDASNTTPMPNNEPTQLAINKAGTRAYVRLRGEMDIYTVNMTSGDTDILGSSIAWAGDIDRGPDGRIYVAGDGTAGLYAIDPANSNAVTELFVPTSSQAVVFTDDEKYMFAKSNNVGLQITGIDLSDDSELDLDGDNTDLIVGGADNLSGGSTSDELLMVSPY